MNEYNELISVIIPTYGRASTVIESINSVTSQTYKNLEIIIVDDNGLGTVNQVLTESIIKSIDFGEVKYKYICHKINMKGAAARNTGIRNSSGRIICFLDDDDFFEPNKIELQFQDLLGKGSAWVASFTGHTRFDANGVLKEYNPPNSNNMLFDILSFNIDACSGSSLMIFRYRLKSDVFFNENLNRHQDYQFLAEVATQGNISSVSKSLVNIRLHTGSYRSSELNQILEDREKYIQSVNHIIQILTPKEQSLILKINNMYCLKRSVKFKNWSKAIEYAISIGSPFWLLTTATSDLYSFIKRKYHD